MESSRRSFLKIAGISALGLGAKPVLDVLASSGETAAPITMKGENALTAKRWGMVIDTRKLQSEEDLEPIDRGFLSCTVCKIVLMIIPGCDMLWADPA